MCPVLHQFGKKLLVKYSSETACLCTERGLFTPARLFHRGPVSGALVSPAPAAELMHIKARNAAKALKAETADGRRAILNLTNPGQRLNPTALVSL